MYDTLFQVHIGTWVFLLIFIGLNLFYRVMILKMLFRLFSLVMLGSGIGLAVYLSFPIIFIIKLVLAILLIGLTEMIIKKEKPKEETTLLLSISAIFIVLVLIGFGFIRF